MKIKIGVSVIALISLISCSTTMKYTWTKENFEGKQFDKVLVLSISKNLKSRKLFENTVVRFLQEEGINATNALHVFSPVEDIKRLSEADIEKKVKDGGYDGILVTALIDINTGIISVNSKNYYPYMYGSHYGNGYSGFIYYSYDYMFNDQHSESKSYALETRLYEVNESNQKKAVVWSGQSESIDPSSSESASKTYSQKMVKTLFESGIIKK